MLWEGGWPRLASRCRGRDLLLLGQSKGSGKSTAVDILAQYLQAEAGGVALLSIGCERTLKGGQELPEGEFRLRGGEIVGDAALPDLEETGQDLMGYVRSVYHYQPDRVSRALSNLTEEEDAP